MRPRGQLKPRVRLLNTAGYDSRLLSIFRSSLKQARCFQIRTFAFTPIHQVIDLLVIVSIEKF